MVSGAGLGFGGFGYGGAAGRGLWVAGTEWQRKKHGDEDDFGFIATDIGTGGGVWVSRGDDRGAAADRISPGKPVLPELFNRNGAGAVLWEVEWHGGIGFGKADSRIDGVGQVRRGSGQAAFANVFERTVATGGVSRRDGG